MIFTETDKYVDAVMVAIDMVARMGFFVPTDNALDSVFAELDALDARNVLNEILSNPDVGMAFPWYENRFERIKAFSWDVKKGMVTFEGHSFIMENAAKNHEKHLLRHFGDMEKVRSYFSSIYALAGLVQDKINDLKTVMRLLKDKLLLNEKESVMKEPDEVKVSGKPDLDETDIFLRSIFGEHLNDFLNEAKKLKKGSDVARLVNSYVREFRLEKSENLNKRLWEALNKKGILTASKSTWNNIIENK